MLNREMSSNIVDVLQLYADNCITVRHLLVIFSQIQVFDVNFCLRPFFYGNGFNGVNEKKKKTVSGCDVCLSTVKTKRSKYKIKNVSFHQFNVLLINHSCVLILDLGT